MPAPPPEQTTRADQHRRGRPPDLAPRTAERNARQRRPAREGAVRNRRLLGVPARTGPRHARPRRDRRPEARERRAHPDGVERGARGARGGGTAADHGRGRDEAPAVQVLPRGRRGRVPVVPRRPAARSGDDPGRPGRANRGPADAPARSDATCSPRPPRSSAPWSARPAFWRSSSPRPTSASGRSRGTCGGAGTRRPASLFNDLDPARVAGTRPQPGRAAVRNDPAAARRSRRRTVAARQAEPRLPPAPRLPRFDVHLGRDPRGRAEGPAGRVLLRGVRPARVAPDLLRRAGHPRRRPRQERQRPGRAARRHRAALRAGLLPPAARQVRLAARGLPEHRHATTPARTADRRRQPPGHGDRRDPRADHLGARVEGDRRPLHAAAARLRRRVEHAGGPATHGAALRRRPPHPHSPGTAPGRRRRPGAARAEDHARASST